VASAPASGLEALVALLLVVPPAEPPVALLVPVVPAVASLVLVVPPDADEPPALVVPPVVLLVPPVASLLVLVVPADAEEPPALVEPPGALVTLIVPPAALLVLVASAGFPAPLVLPPRPAVPPPPGLVLLPQAATARATIPNAKPTIGLCMLSPAADYTAELTIASDAYNAPATPKTRPAPLLAGAIVGIKRAIALSVDPVRGKSSSMWRVKNQAVATPVAMPIPNAAVTPGVRASLPAMAQYSPPTSSPPPRPPRSMKRTRAMDGET
jgi:hypothetical protein